MKRVYLHRENLRGNSKDRRFFAEIDGKKYYRGALIICPEACPEREGQGIDILHITDFYYISDAEGKIYQLVPVVKIENKTYPVKREGMLQYIEIDERKPNLSC